MVSLPEFDQRFPVLLVQFDLALEHAVFVLDELVKSVFVVLDVLPALTVLVVLAVLVVSVVWAVWVALSGMGAVMAVMAVFSLVLALSLSVVLVVRIDLS